MSLTMEQFLALQNGSDVRGVAMDGRPGEAVNLTAEAVNRIAAAYTTWLAGKTGKPVDKLKIAVGVDSRLTGPALKGEALKAIIGTGAEGYDCGLASTPAMFMSIVFDEKVEPDFPAMDGSIMITASHLPFNRNGMKFFTAEGGLEKGDIKELLMKAADTQEISGSLKDAVSYPLIERYCNHLRGVICKGLGVAERDKPLSDMHIVIDAGSGAGGFFAGGVLEPLGADVSGSLYLAPDGMFPYHEPNPENAKAMESIRNGVLAAKADLGLIFDTDVDRMSAVLEDGTEVSRNALIAMIAAVLAPDYPGSTIITDSVTSDELAEFLTKELGLVHHRFQRGYKNVINECRRLNSEGTVSPLAIETSGHGALLENYYLDDGAYLAVKLVIAAAKARREGRRLGDLIAKLGYPAEAEEYRLKITGVDNVANYGGIVLEAFEYRAKEAGIKIATPSYEGVRLVFPDGWALLRRSLHDPLLPLNVEGRRPGSVKAIVCQLRGLLSGFENLDLNPLL